MLWWHAVGSEYARRQHFVCKPRRNNVADVSTDRQTVTFGVRRVRGEMYIVMAVCVYVPRRIPTLLHGPGCNFGNGMGCPLVVKLLGGFAIGARVSLRRTRNSSECLY